MKAWDWGGFFDYLVNPYLLQGAVVTLGLTVAAIAGGLVVGCLLSLLRLSNYKWLVLLAKGYIWIFRGTPLLVQLTMLYVVLPQAIRIIIPALGNSVNGLLKTTSVTSVISMEELLRKTQILIQEKFLVLELFAVAAIYYLLLTSLWDVIQRRIEARYGRAYKSISISEGH